MKNTTKNYKIGSRKEEYSIVKRKNTPKKKKKYYIYGEFYIVKKLIWTKRKNLDENQILSFVNLLLGKSKKKRLRMHVYPKKKK